MKIIRAAECRRMPWKNGGGETVEIAVSPDGAGLDDFGWRISSATVARDGDFSLFPGVDRTLCVLDGAGLVLHVEGRETVRLDCGSTPHSFSADRPTRATLVDGPITDLNIMTRRGSYTHEARVLDTGRPVQMQGQTGVVRILFCCFGRVLLDGIAVSAGDCALLPVGSGPVSVIADGPARLIRIDLHHVADTELP